MDPHELLDIVDEKDNVIGKDTKENKFQKELISRNVAIFIKDSQGNYIVVKRAPDKRSFPNRLDLAACGNVAFGESYEDAAKREIQEELGISCQVKLLKKIFNETPENDKKVKYFTSIFLGTCDDEVNLNEELTHFKKIPLIEFKEKINANPDLFSPFLLTDFIAVESLLE